MQQFIIHLNGGYNPFVRLGRGALGYRPLRKMIGRGGDDDKLGGGEGYPSKETVLNNIKTNYQEYLDTNKPVYYHEAKENERLLAIIESVEQKEAAEKARAEEKAQAEEKEAVTSEIMNLLASIPVTTKPLIVKKYDDAITEIKNTKPNIQSIEGVDQDINLTDLITSMFDNINVTLNDNIAKKKNMEEQLNNLNVLIDQLNNTISTIENKDIKSKDYHRTLKTTAYVNSIESLYVFIQNNTNNNAIADLANSEIQQLFNKLNAPGYYKDGRTFKFNQDDGKVVRIDKISTQTGPLDFEFNLTVKEVNDEVDKYWKSNIKTVLDPDAYGEEFKDIIKEINDTVLYEDKYTDDMYEKSKELTMKLPNQDLAYKYMKPIIINNKSKYYNADGTLIMTTMTNKVTDAVETVSLLYKEYISPGKPSEFSICGLDNKLAKKIYGFEHPNIQNADYIVENILVQQNKKGGTSKQFCIDHVDTTNKIFSEMKAYKSMTKLKYKEMYRANIKLKKKYINQLKKELDANIEAYLKEKRKKPVNMENVNKYMSNIDALRKVLSDKKEFEKDFYKNKRYIGIGVTMNKFNEIIIPTGYDFNDSPSTEKEMLHVKESQGQKFIPHIIDRKIVKITSANNDKEFDKAFNNAINISKKNSYDYMITCTLVDGVCVYNYTKDGLVENDFILGTYKCAYPSDSRDYKYYNAVLIPIEMFDLKI
jgi:hypothetical protein